MLNPTYADLSDEVKKQFEDLASKNINQATVFLNNQFLFLKNKKEQVEAQNKDILMSDLKNIKGITEKTIGKLIDAGINSKEELEKYSNDELKCILTPIEVKQITSWLK